MTRKLCKFSGKNSQANFRVVFYPACIETALIWQNYLQTKKCWSKLCVCVSVFQFSMKVAMKTLGSYILPLFQLQANYKYGNNFHIQVTRNGPTQQAPWPSSSWSLDGIFCCNIENPFEKKKQSSSTLKHTTWKQTVSENSLKSIVVNSKNINKINIPKPEQSTFLQQCPLLKVLHKSSFSVGPVGGAPIFWWFLKGEIPDLESSCRRLREPEMSQYLKWGVDPNVQVVCSILQTFHPTKKG